MMETDYIITIDNKHPNIDGGYRVKKTQELIRCKDCKYGYVYHDGDEPNGVVCDGVWHGDYWFCADGERREDDA